MSERGYDRPAPLLEADRRSTAFIVDVDGFEGPIDLLLSLARDQRVDLKHISILQLAEQYLAFIAAARRASLDLAAEYLVTAAWLAFLKSRLLLPQAPGAEEPSGEEMAAALAFQLRRLEGIREAAGQLMTRNQLGRDVFPRGEIERPQETQVIVAAKVELADLLRSYGAHLARKRPAGLRVAPCNLSSVDEAVKRLRAMLGGFAEWVALADLLPAGTTSELGRDHLAARSALAATFAASLELAREGVLRIRQATPFGPVYLRAAESEDRKQ